MNDTISRQAAVNEIDEWIEAFRENGHKESASDALFIQVGIGALPPAQPTLYGYEIEHLAYIARVMEKEGITAEEAVRTFGDMKRALSMIIDETRQKIEEAFYEQAGMQAGVPAAQTGDGSGDKQEGSAEGGGDLQAEAIRSSERPAETEGEAG